MWQHVLAGRGQACALAIDLEQAVIGERKIVGVERVVLLGKRSAGKLDIGIVELPKGFARRSARRPH
jgi:hypothetical protein